MHPDKFIQYIKEGNINLLDVKEVLAIISLAQTSIHKILHFSLSDDRYITITKILWPLVEEDENGLVKYYLYCHLLTHETFNEKTARYICLKERELKILNTGLLGKCGTIKAVDFVLNAYNLNVFNIIDGVASCSYEGQIPIMKHLLSRLNELQKNIALNKFITAYLEEYPRDLNLVAFVLRQKDVWNNEVLENEQIKKLILFNNIDKKLIESEKRSKSKKI